MELNFPQIARSGFPKPAARVYLFVGGDDALKREAVDKLTIPLLDPSSADFDREVFEVGLDNDADQVRSILAAAAGAPMFSERRVVVANNVQRLGKDEQDTLAAGLQRLCELSCLVLVAGAPEYEGGRPKGRTTVGTKLQNAAAKAGVVVTCDPPGAADLKSRAAEILRERGKTAEPAALEVLSRTAIIAAADRGGGGKAGDLLVLMHELEKVIAYSGDRPRITQADALAVASRGSEENIFALLDAVGNRSAPRALGQVDQMMRAGERPDGVTARALVMLARQLRMIFAAKYLGDNKGAEAQEPLSGEMLGLATRQSYLLKSLQDQGRKWTYDQLRAGLGRVLASDMSLKGVPPISALGYRADSGEDPEGNLRTLIIALCEG